MFEQQYDFFAAPDMCVDMKERDGQLLIEIELPGYPKENITAQLERGYLTIHANRNLGLEDGKYNTNYLIKERKTGEIKRTFFVGELVRQEDIFASLSDGVLSVIIKKQEPQVEGSRVKLININ